VRRLRRIDPRYGDWLFAFALAVGGIIEIATIDDLRGPLIVNLALVSLLAPAALLRRRRPLVAVFIWGSVALLMAAFFTQPAELNSLFLGLILFPLLALGSSPSPFVNQTVEQLRASGHDVSIEGVPYEFQRGANQMMRIRSQPLHTHRAID